MTSKGDFYAPPQEQAYQQQGGGAAYKDQDYEIIEAGLVPNINTGGAGSAADLEKQLRLGEKDGPAACCADSLGVSSPFDTFVNYQVSHFSRMARAQTWCYL